MKPRFTILAVMLLLASTSLFAQRPAKEKIKALKVAFITERLDLSSKEAQQFWPIYNAFDEASYKLKNEDLGKIKRQLRASGGDISDNEAEQLLQEMLDIEKNLHAERIKLVTDLRKVISARKIILLRKAEDDFNREIIKKFREQRKRRFGNN
ncbi:Spy/CpxP family protein refolding chaperone [Sungkyunkwania multivorans]|uniref:Spy/CpxP family protein refolding chaperone n=1 Tax=Sungkyunkwania multivorans TaxID=1173618 RepID=A0ABW3CZV0_9FLAO